MKKRITRFVCSFCMMLLMAAHAQAEHKGGIVLVLSGGAMRGRMRQHHAIRLRRARASPAESAALWDDGPSSQERNSSSVRSRLRRRCGIVELNRQAGHFHRWTPLPVRPFFFIARPHTGHLFALLDGVLTPSSPPPGTHHFPRDKNDRPTRLLPQGRATVISTTKVPIGPNLPCY